MAETPARLRAAGLLEWLSIAGLEVADRGDVPVPTDWYPPEPPLQPAKLPPPPADSGAAPVPTSSDTGGSSLSHLAEVIQVQRAVHDAVSAVLQAGELPLLIGGECGVAPAAVAAITSATGAPPVIVWLDAHGDLNTPETSPSGLLTGMPLALALGNGHPDVLAVGAGAPRPSAGSTWLIGARDLDAGELASPPYQSIHHVTVETLRSIGAEQMVEEILPEVPILPPEARPGGSSRQAGDHDERSDSIYLHIDVDSIDPSEAPGVTFPVPGGLTAAEVADLAGYVCASGRLAALTIASASLPADRNETTLKSIRRLLTSISDALALSG